MPIHNPILPLAGWGLLVLGATSYPNNSAAETKPALQIEHDAVNDEVNLSFEASQTDRYYLLEGRSSLDDLTGTDWRAGYGVKGDGTPRKTHMPMPTDTGFYRLLRVDQDSPRLQIDYDGDRVTALEELNRGLDAFEQSPDDRDGDFIPSDFEVIYGLDPQDPSDALIDDDRDGINNVNEYRLGDDPHTEEADRFTLSVYVEQKVLHHGCETYIQESSPLYSYRHQTGQARTSGHLFYNLLSDCGSQRDRNEWKIDTKGWEWRTFNCSLTEEYLRGVNFEVLKESGFYQILNCVGSPMTFLIEHDEHLLVDMGRQSWTQPTENTETSYEVAHWDGRQLTIDGAPIALPTGRRGCKYTYGHVELPYWVDLDILHPASGRLKEELEDKDYDSSGGYVALKREIDGEDVAPVTQLQLRRCSHYEMEHYRLKFDSGGRYRIYSDANRTQEIISEQTEFTAGTETTVYLQGLSVSDSLGGEEVTLQVGLSGNWYATDSVNFTVVQAEFPVVVRAFIPYLWSEPEQPASYWDLWMGIFYTIIAEGDARNFIRKNDNDDISYRARQRVVITPYKDLHGSFDRIAEREVNTAKLSSHHVKQLSVPLLNVLDKHGDRWDEDGPYLYKSGEPKVVSQSYSSTFYADKTVGLMISGAFEDGAMPWYVPSTLTPDLDWEIDIIVDSHTDPLNPKISAAGKRDKFPAYEIIFQRSDDSYEELYFFLPPYLRQPGISTLGFSEDFATSIITIE